jgi:hypothetical protein
MVRSVLFLAVAFAMILVVVADGDYGNYGNDYHKRYTALTINKAYSKGVIIGKVPALGKRYGAYWEKCAGDHYFQTHPADPGYSTVYLQFTAFSGNSKGYNYGSGYQAGCTEARDSVAVEYKEEGDYKWKTLVTLKPDNYRTPKSVSYKVPVQGYPCKLVFRFRSLNDCKYDNNDYGVWSFADLKLYSVGKKDYGNDYGNDRDDDYYGGGNKGGYGGDRDDDDHDDDYYGGGNKDGYGNDRDDDDYGNDRDHDDGYYGGGNKGGYGGGNKGYGDDRDCD